MLTREDLIKNSLRLDNYCEYPAVRYKILIHLLGMPYEDKELISLRKAFLVSDIVEELYQTQDSYGRWGKFQSKDYSVKDKFPTSSVAINHCLYIDLTIEDRDILFCANEYLEDFLNGNARERFINTNERVIPWKTASVCIMIEVIKPYNPLCDRTYSEWMYIVNHTFEDGEYSYEKERAAQHEVFCTREDHLVPIQIGLLLKRRDQVCPGLEDAMLRHYGKHASEHGHFWNKTPGTLPEIFMYNKTHRWFDTFNYINQFHGSALFLADSVKWLMDNQNSDGL